MLCDVQTDKAVVTMDIEEEGILAKILVHSIIDSFQHKPDCQGPKILAHWIRLSEILPWDRKSYLTHAILPRTSSNVIM